MYRFKFEFLKLIWLLVLHVPPKSSFISNKFFALNLDGWFGVLSDNFFLIFHYIIIYINLRSAVIPCLFSGDMVSFLKYFTIKSNIFCFICNCQLFCGELLETLYLVISSSILLPIFLLLFLMQLWVHL